MPAAYILSSSFVWSLLRSHTAPQCRRNPTAAIWFDPSNPSPMTMSNACRKLASSIVCHPYAHPPSPLASGRQFTVPPPTQALPVRVVARRLARGLSIRSALQVRGVGSC
ncbi:hypothetical protein K443DRAFT_274316 [Laccaria amethystina LaAM-08-1]|uniref:Unplaced genomic scaffold K443scaffold_177, whole genome shotgun sequence n=1 Tax=Laccaria amethystina LaAM-08-1 TaxID=1095629 RepID=A0A0C9WKX0_9AGAR|nr:hypothetical protein K443DRAFT_274316 [Laccaria amethystina LaAM-08-1]